jgi:precorrin-4 methylase
MSSKVALQLNAVVGLASAVAASAMMTLVLTRPEAMASAVAQREYGAVAMAVARQVADWLTALWRYL